MLGQGRLCTTYFQPEEVVRGANMVDLTHPPQMLGRCLCPVRLVRFLEVKNERGVQKPGGVSGSDF